MRQTTHGLARCYINDCCTHCQTQSWQRSSWFWCTKEAGQPSCQARRKCSGPSSRTPAGTGRHTRKHVTVRPSPCPSWHLALAPALGALGALGAAFSSAKHSAAHSAAQTFSKRSACMFCTKSDLSQRFSIRPTPTLNWKRIGAVKEGEHVARVRYAACESERGHWQFSMCV